MEMVEEVKKSNERLFGLHAGTIAEPFVLDDFSGILEFDPCIIALRKLFIPGSMPKNVVCECNGNGREALFNGSRSHLKINSDIYLDPGVNWFGTVDLSGAKRGKQLSAIFFCCNSVGDSPAWPVFEERQADNAHARLTAKMTPLWKGGEFSMIRYDIPPCDRDRQIAVGIDVRDRGRSWAALLQSLEM